MFRRAGAANKGMSRLRRDAVLMLRNPKYPRYLFNCWLRSW